MGRLTPRSGWVNGQTIGRLPRPSSFEGVRMQEEPAPGKLGERVIAYHDLGVKVVKNVLIPMADGVRLAADVYLPLDGELDGSARYPLVLEYIPYRKDDVGRPEGTWYARLPLAGYPLVRVDIRGSGASEGTVADEYTEEEQ